METIWNEVNVDVNFTTYTKFTQSYPEANFILVSNSFLAALGLRFCARAFSSCGKRGPPFIAVRGPLTSWPLSISWRSTGSRRAGSVVVAHGPSCSAARGIFPDQGYEPVSPALAGRFLTTAPPGKPLNHLFLTHFFLFYLHACMYFCVKILNVY